ncbi:MAG: hypothetical protein H6584_07365 [Flavobacteriales bacterium]|nr:hypothetical protein [Flavobacteriales bacterium]
MIAIGGELPLIRRDYQVGFTDSGRSSLRLFLRGTDCRDKRFLIPDFLCEVIEDVLKSEEVQYSFYRVKSDLTIDYSTLDVDHYDVLYLINYFGKNTHVDSLYYQDKIVLEDSVFSINFENRLKAIKWFGFNSFRKVSNLVDGSMIKTNLQVDWLLIRNETAPFVQTKTEAKNKKNEYLRYSIGSEEEYLTLFNKGEQEIDQQKEIFRMSSNSMEQLLTIKDSNDQEIARSRFDVLSSFALGSVFENKPEHISYFVFNHCSKNKIYAYLRSKSIYLPNFWPSGKRENELYSNLIAVPLYSYYEQDKFDRLKEEIKKII